MVDSITLLAVNDATVIGWVKELDGTALQHFDLTYSAGSSGDYVGTLTASQTTGLIQGNEYLVEITATSGTSVDKRVERHTAEYRGFKQ